MNDTHKKTFDFNNYIIEKYQLKELLYPSVNESFLEELMKGNSDDWNETKRILAKMRVLIPRLVIKLTRLGARTSINLIIATAKRALKQGKKHKIVIRDLFFSLVCLLTALTTNTVIDKYNSNPPIDGTQIEQNGDSILVHDQNSETDLEVKIDEKKNVSVKEVAKNKTAKTAVNAEKNKSREPIRLLKDGETAPMEYHYSEYMINALAEVEDFSEQIYDARVPGKKRHPRSQKELLGKGDWTIGYGHKLTRKERKAWKFNMKCSKAEAMKLFKADLRQKELEFNNALRTLPYYNKCVFSQGFVDSFGSLVYNAGIGNICGNNRRKPSEFWNRLSKVRIDTQNKCFNKDDINYIISQIKKQNITQKGHKYRRNAEAKIMAMGDNLNPEHYHLLAPEYRK